MRAVDIIIKKRERGELTRAEINFFVHGLTNGRIPDYQVSAWAMAVLLNGMTPRETTDLTLAMAQSGEILDMTDFVKGVVVDKHSTGGVGDKTTLVVLPVAAACGLPAGKMSGRGLGFSGGTLDKMESFPGYRVDLTTDEFVQQLKEIGIVLSGQTRDLAPADGKLYALRDVTGTVQSLPLIASSIMSKKIAAGAQAVVLDVKVGLGAFMKTIEEARALAQMMVSIGELAGRRVITVLSDMNQPLGQAVGNDLEVREALDTLRGGGPQDFREHCLHVSAHMLVLGEIAPTLDIGRVFAERAINDGTALQKLRTLVAAQGGDVSFVDDPEKFPQAKLVEPLTATRSGFLSQVNAQVIGEESVSLGAGRAKKGDPIDHTVGLIVHRRVGDRVERGDVLATIHAHDAATLSGVRERLMSAFAWSDSPVPALPLFYE
jgi:pyrimidine-nucleoside phosphorylase